MARKKTDAERRADAAEEAAIRHSLHYHTSLGRLNRDVAEAARRDAAERRLEARLHYGSPRRKPSRQRRPKWTGRAR